MPQALKRRVQVEGWLAGDLLGKMLCQYPIHGGTLVLRGMKWLLGRLIERLAFAACWGGILLGSCRSFHGRLGMCPHLRVLHVFAGRRQLVLVAWEEPTVHHVRSARGGCLRVLEVRVEHFGHALQRVH